MTFSTQIRLMAFPATSSHPIPLPPEAPTLIQPPEEFKGGEKASLGLSSNPAFCSILHFTVGDQSSPAITTAQKKLRVSGPPAWSSLCRDPKAEITKSQPKPL